MSEVQETHINAFRAELAEAETELVQAESKVRQLKRQINEKLAADGLDPEYDEEGEPITHQRRTRKTTHEDTPKDAPPEASGFGSKGGNN